MTFRNEHIGFQPKIGPFHNSGYMADHVDSLVKQVKTWMDGDCLISHSQHPGHKAALGKNRLQFKTTIEPK